VTDDGAGGDLRRSRGPDGGRGGRGGGGQGEQPASDRGVGQHQQSRSGQGGQALLVPAGHEVALPDPGEFDRVDVRLGGTPDTLAQPLVGLVQQDGSGAAAGAEVLGDGVEGAALDFGEPQDAQPALRELAQH
jgi:hypothetical protein